MVITTIQIVAYISSSLSAHKYLNLGMNSFSFSACSKCNTWPSSCGCNYDCNNASQTFCLWGLTLYSYISPPLTTVPIYAMSLLSSRNF